MQLRFNAMLVLVTALLVVTSIVSDLLMLRYVSLTKQSADASKQSADAATSAAVTANTTLEHSEKSFKTEVRPYLNLRTAELIKALAPDTKPTIRLSFFNNGKTPAIHETVLVGIVRRKNEIGDDEPNPPPIKYQSRSVTGP